MDSGKNRLPKPSRIEMVWPSERFLYFVCPFLILFLFVLPLDRKRAIHSDTGQLAFTIAPTDQDRKINMSTSFYENLYDKIQDISKLPIEEAVLTTAPHVSPSITRDYPVLLKVDTNLKGGVGIAVAIRVPEVAADDMKGTIQIWPCVAKRDAHGFAHICALGVCLWSGLTRYR